MTQPAPDDPKKTSRTIFAPRGTELTCRSWLTEAPYRMIQNNLDPDQDYSGSSDKELRSAMNGKSIPYRVGRKWFGMFFWDRPVLVESCHFSV